LLDSLLQEMSRLSDAQRLLSGLAKIGEARMKVSQKEVQELWVRVEPVLIQAVKVATSISTELQSDKKPQTGLSLSKSFDNLPLVVEGVSIYSRHILGLPVTFDEQGRVKTDMNLGDSSEGKDPEMELNKDLSSLDLLDIDLTNERLLKEKLFIRTPAKEEIIDKNEVPKKPPDILTDSVKVDELNLLTGNIPVNVDTKISKGIDKDFIQSNIVEPKLSEKAQERRVPANRMSRLVSFASLGVGLGVGTLAEASRRAVGMRKVPSNKDGEGASLDGSLILNEANAERIVRTLCRVRGAALKLGQILSIQDGAVIGPELRAIFDRVRESADFMPQKQLEQVMGAQLGSGWRERFREFRDQPFAAASIGEVHYAELHDGTPVAVKVQYPGVAQAIDSDIQNLLSLISVLAILPPGLFIENIAKHMKVELGQECDYKREGDCGLRMKRILAQYPEYHVPAVYQELSTEQVLVTEYLTGLTIDRCVELDQRTRDFIAESILKLVFRELFLHRFMQTDPNWANFLYNPHTGKIGLLDFGATREYRPGFVNTYFKIIDAAAQQDRQGVLEHSRDIGFLLPYESKVMNEAHIDSVMLLATPFHTDTPFHFGAQKITSQIQELSSVMLKERLCPPPPEVYSLHRKLSGLFLLAGKLDSSFNCCGIWQDIRASFKPFS